MGALGLDNLIGARDALAAAGVLESHLFDGPIPARKQEPRSFPGVIPKRAAFVWRRDDPLLKIMAMECV